MMLPTKPVLTALLITAVSPMAAAQPGDLTESSKLTASDAAFADRFGTSVAIDNGIVAVGVPGDDDNSRDSGSVYFFDAATGTHLFKLLPNDGALEDAFGTSVDIDNGVVAVGADFGNIDDGVHSGSAYLFDTATGVQLFKLIANDGAIGDAFGRSIAIDSGIVAVGAPFDADNGFDSGSVYLYDASTGVQLFKLLTSDGEPRDHFGLSIAIDNGIVAVGANGDDDNGLNSGSVYLFDASTGAQITKLLPSDGAEVDHFGIAIAINNGIVAVGALADDDNGDRSGSAYLFDANTGAQLFKLLPNDGAAQDFFGSSIAIGNGIVAVGAISDDDNGDRSGSAYLFDANTGAQITKLLPSDGAAQDSFGSSITINNGVVAAGAHLDDDNGIDSGSAYIFDLANTTPCLADTNNDGKLTPADFTAWINAFNNSLPECDQNTDGVCTPADFTAWIANFNGGCD